MSVSSALAFLAIRHNAGGGALTGGDGGTLTEERAGEMDGYDRGRGGQGGSLEAWRQRTDIRRHYRAKLRSHGDSS